MYDEYWDGPLWGVPKIAEAAGLTPRQAYHKIEKKLLPATPVGGTYVSTRRRLRAVWTGEKLTQPAE
jgi:hypothetical protein